ncbi:MAG: MFS transporter [Rhodospirillaceae bacterium]|nr:MFS transporter [Rhodospirillaceae bacterium]
MSDASARDAKAKPGYELTRVQQLGWSAGAIGTSIMIGAVSNYTLYILTTLMGVGAATAGLLIGLSKVFDVLIDPIIGRISDRTDSRWGRRRPFLLAGVVLAPLGFLALFSAPSLVDGTVAVVYIGAVLVLIALGTSLFMVPYMAMAAEMTGNYNERTVLMSQRVFFNTVALLLMTVMLPNLIKQFGGGPAGYLSGGIIMAALVAWFFAQTFWLTRNAKFVAKTPDDAYTLRDQLKFIAGNKSFAVFIGAKICSFLAQSFLQGTLLLYGLYILARDERFLAPFGAGYTIGSLVALPVWAWLMTRKVSKRNAYIFSILGLGAVFLTWWFATPQEPTWVALARFLLVGAFSAGSMTAGTAMLPDIMELDRRKSGVGQEGLYAAAYTLVENVGSAIGPVILGFTLSLTGFVSTKGQGLVEQPPGALMTLTMCVSVVPAVFAGLGAFLMRGYTVETELQNPVPQSK